MMINKMNDYWSSEIWSSLASCYTIDLLDFFNWISDEDVGFGLWNADPDEFVNQCEVRDIELLLDFSGCLDAKL